MTIVLVVVAVVIVIMMKVLKIAMVMSTINQRHLRPVPKSPSLSLLMLTDAAAVGG